MTIRLSVLDQSPISEGGCAQDALRATVDIARAADELGVTRYWLAEHHNSPGFAGPAPEVLAAILLANTRRMRIGSGGVLLPRYSPAKVAEVFGVLANLYPNRVDLGLGRAGGPAEDFPLRVATLVDQLADHHDLQVWLLGAGGTSAELAAEFNTAFCYAHFLNPHDGVDTLATYRSGGDRAALAVRVFVAETDAKAEELANAFLLWRSRKDLGEDLPVPAPETVRHHRWTDSELTRARRHRQALVHGTPDQIRSTLRDLTQTHQVDELVVNTLTHDPADRPTCYRLLVDLLASLPDADDAPARKGTEESLVL
jgi:alkanesulfonate monooxygenase SsuD/methylene tetrahydromethanopterin reductase-like flavin-dependent oxidoreductase (luciferase family)